MRILDRYILTNFIRNYVISLMVLIGLYIVLDMVFNLDEVAAIQRRAGVTGVEGLWRTMLNLLDYYFYQGFLIFVQLSGIIPVAAAGFTLLRMSRFNELTAWLAAGVPMLRLAMPIIVMAVLLNGLLVVDTELVLPNMIDKLNRSHSEMYAEGSSAFEISGIQDDQRAVLSAMRFQPATTHTSAAMYDLDIVERDENLNVSAHTRANRAVWNSAKQLWDLTGGLRYTGLMPDQTRSTGEPRAQFITSITPEEIAIFRRAGFVQLLSTRRINELLARPEQYGRANLLRMKHLRFTQPIMNVILLLLAIPAVLNHDPTRLKMAATQCLTLTGLAMSSVFLAQQLAGRPPAGPGWTELWPALMAWMPIFVFAPISVWLLDRVRT